LTLALVAMALTPLVVPLATGHRPAAGAQPAAVVAQQTGRERPSHILRPAPARLDPGEPMPTDEPIAYIGHGGFFDQNGRQIVPTAEFVEKAQDWYRQRLLAGLKDDQRSELASFEKRLGEGLKLDGQAKLVLQQRSLDWLLARSPRTIAMGRTQAKLNALKYRLSWRLPVRDDPEELQNLEPFELDPRIEERLKLPEDLRGKTLHMPEFSDAETCAHFFPGRTLGFHRTINALLTREVRSRGGRS
jgi:hypothetical protein